MKSTKLLLPTGFKTLGWWMLAAGAALFLVYSVVPYGYLPACWNDFRALFGLERLSIQVNHFSGFDAESNLVLTLTGLLLVVGGVFVGFSRMRDEDEFIGQMRYESLVVALYVNSGLMVLALVFVWGVDFLKVMMYNVFSTLVVFLLCFYFRLFVAKRRLGHEE